MLVDDDAERLSMLEQALVAEGHTIAARLTRMPICPRR